MKWSKKNIAVSPHVKLLLLAMLVAASGVRSVMAGSAEGHSAYMKGDYVAAMREFRPLATRGDPAAQIAVGWLYDNALGVPHDDAEAIKWYRLAAGQGCATAEQFLGIMYAEGEGTPKNLGEAANWFRLAAEQGDAGGQFGLGVIYSHGDGVARDPIEALKWFRLASVTPEQADLASSAAAELSPSMTPEQIQKAERLARAWVPPHPMVMAKAQRCSFTPPH